MLKKFPSRKKIQDGVHPKIFFQDGVEKKIQDVLRIFGTSAFFQKFADTHYSGGSSSKGPKSDKGDQGIQGSTLLKINVFLQQQLL